MLEPEVPTHIQGEHTEPPSSAPPSVEATESVVREPSAAPPPELTPTSDRSKPSSTQAPPFEGTEPAFLPPSYSFAHSARPSLDNIKFGVTQESPAVPSTPQEPEFDSRAPTQPFPPGHAPPLYAPSFYPGHSHHPSETQEAWTQPALAVGLSNGTHPPALPAQVAYHGNPQESSSPHVSKVTNGFVSSQSQSPLKSQYGETRAGSEQGVDLRGAQTQYGIPLPIQDPRSQSFGIVPYKEPITLIDTGYLTAQFGTLKYPNFLLRVRRNDEALLSMLVYGIFVARSPTIASALEDVQSASQPNGSPLIIDVFTRDRFVIRESLEDAVKALYGALLPPVEPLVYGLAPFDPAGDEGPVYSDARSRMSKAINYAAVGRFLRLDIIEEQGSAIIKPLVRWDTVDEALAFALASSGFSEVRSANFLYNGHVFPPEEYHSTTLLNYISDFIAFNFPLDFTLYTIAPQLVDAPRLPTLTPSIEKPGHNPQLSRIRFGEVPTGDFITRILSSVLVSVPLPFLNRLLNHREVVARIGGHGVRDIMGAVVGERERRREQAWRHQAKILEAGGRSYSKLQMENVLWKEQVVFTSEARSGFILSETRLEDQV